MYLQIENSLHFLIRVFSNTTEYGVSLLNNTGK